MRRTPDDLYYKGYIAGYRDGILDAAKGIKPDMVQDANNLPLAAAPLSARARNCLHSAGCKSVTDAAKLSDQAIATMRNLGPKTASEIAHWLDLQGIRFSAWSKYL